MKNGDIVIIDDNKAEIMLLKEALKSVNLQHGIVEFYDSESAFEYILHNPQNISVIISDTNMPPMTGMDLLGKINETPEIKMEFIPFIFLTNSASPKDIELAYSLGTKGYFRKPLELNDLSEMVKTIVNYWDMVQMPSAVDAEMPHN